MGKAPTIHELFLSFFRLGLTAFGGPAMVAEIRKMAVGKKEWLSDASFRDGASLCQMVPGATAMQAAAYVGLARCSFADRDRTRRPGRWCGTQGRCGSSTGRGRNLPASASLRCRRRRYRRRARSERPEPMPRWLQKAPTRGWSRPNGAWSPCCAAHKPWQV